MREGMASSSSSCCCVPSSHATASGLAGCFRRPVPRLRARAASTATSPTRLYLIFPNAPSRSSRIPASPDPPLHLAAADDDGQEDRDDRIGLQIQVSKTGKRNRCLVSARVRVDAPLEAVWATLTNYEGLADFIPGLSECRLLHQDDGFARLYQVGEQDLALGFKFNAKGTIDCFEGEIEVLPESGARRRDIAFNMIDGDFKLFQGKWSVQEVDAGIIGGDSSEDQEFQTTLSYLVELEPKLWVPVRLLEGRICSEIKNNLVSIREEAQRIHSRLQLEEDMKKTTMMMVEQS